MSEESHHEVNYVKIWVILLVLLGVSLIGPTFEIKVVTLITAFGVAVVKAYLVAKNFMHLNIQPRFVIYIVSTCLVFMFLFYFGVAPDVYKGEGTNWVKIEVDPVIAADAGHTSDDAHEPVHH